MSNAKTGLAAAAGALLGGALGAAAGKYTPTRVSKKDAMVVGGAAGATLGAFIGATVAGEEPPPELPIAVQR
jgi:outer membrane lipoprotein SlyB